MPYRDDIEASRARADALEDEVVELERRLEARWTRVKELRFKCYWAREELTLLRGGIRGKRGLFVGLYSACAFLVVGGLLEEPGQTSGAGVFSGGC